MEFTTVVSIAGDGHDDAGHHRRPLLSSDDEIRPYPASPSPAPDANPDQKPRRVASLDVFRGLTVAMMILVDDAGGAWPGINHSPWFGVTVADFVMPAFLFIIGVSAALVFKKTPNKTAATTKAATRAIKLFVLGVILQGGYIHGRHSLTYGVDLDHIRWLGVLQRIAIGYFIAAISEIWLINNIPVDSAISFMKKYFMEWIMAIMISALYVGLLLGLYVSNWEFKVQTSNSILTIPTPSNEVGMKMIQCGVRGSLGPPCNAVGLVDRILLGENHLYKNPVYKRTKECSVNSPDYGPPPPNAPDWCLAPFDPEGLLSKPLYTVSYMLLTGGVSGFLLLLLYYIVDVINIKKPFILFQWMGMNALIVYVLAACELFPALVQGFYWRSPENNLVDVTESLLQTIFHSKRWGTLAFVLLEIIFWCLAACFLHMKGIYLKL
uniref:Heparan-alpha-glucosaminide N-acetyltransferase catalytic domain-containing protein n=1 Tax=Leersia perrieri TaxID=77586 RepID=A0A0D9WD07_9ORYZ